ncbi:MAG: hypothetical protein QNJ97_00845 [Myxococcota bacterium]|nr:hypothetical protein [Myxococcota bacterium]
MKILRIRKGYTTNSSGANEWVPPKNLKLLSDAGPESFSIKVLSGQSASKWSPDAKQVTILATTPPPDRGEQAAEKAETQQSRANVEATKNATNLGLLGVLIGAVFFLFGLTAFIRRIVRKRQ